MKIISISEANLTKANANFSAKQHENVLESLQQALPKGVVHFAYIKADGSVRDAIGTQNPELLEKLLGKREEGGSTKAPNPNLINYYDFDAKAFRSFNISNLAILY